MEEKILQKMTEILNSKLRVSKDQVTLDTHFQNDLNADSLDLVEIVMAVEDVYNIEISDDDVAEIQTVRDAVNILKKYIKN